jgi:hypothetical protein
VAQPALLIFAFKLTKDHRNTSIFIRPNQDFMQEYPRENPFQLTILGNLLGIPSTAQVIERWETDS